MPDTDNNPDNDPERVEFEEQMRAMLRAAACIVHEYVDSPVFNWGRDIKQIRAIVDGASNLNVIMQAAKEVT